MLEHSTRQRNPEMMLAFAAQTRPARTFLSPDNALGFGVGDTFELTAVVLIGLVLVFWAAASMRRQRAIRADSRWWFVVFAILPVLLRLCLVPRSPAPIPSGADDFSYILLADTLRHFRLANPPHPFSEFFEQVFVLQQPTHSSMYPLGQGLFLAFGWLVFGHPWAGVLLSVAALSATCYWMLRAWTSPTWALAGGLLVCLEFGPLSYWTNSYWGGAVSATAGCLVFGALPRIANTARVRDSALLGFGLALQVLTRPFEFCFLLVSALLFFPLDGASLRLEPGTFRSNRRVFTRPRFTGCHRRSQQASYRALDHPALYAVPLSIRDAGKLYLPAKPDPSPAIERRAGSCIPRSIGDPWYGSGNALRLTSNGLRFALRFLRFFLLPPLYVAAVAFLFRIRSPRRLWIALTHWRISTRQQLLSVFLSSLRGGDYRIVRSCLGHRPRAARQRDD